jgi:hypothetical protein
MRPSANAQRAAGLPLERNHHRIAQPIAMFCHHPSRRRQISITELMFVAEKMVLN